MLLFQSESTFYICLNVKEHLAQNRCDIWRLSDCNRIRTHNHLVPKRKLNHLNKLIKSLSWVVNAYLYDAFDSMFLSCHVLVSEWIHTLYLPECKRSPCSKQARYLKIDDSNGTRTHNHIWPNGWVFIYQLSGCGFESCCSHLIFRYCTCFEQGVLDIQANIECEITLKFVRHMTITYSQMYRTNKHS